MTIKELRDLLADIDPIYNDAPVLTFSLDHELVNVRMDFDYVEKFKNGTYYEYYGDEYMSKDEKTTKVKALIFE